MKLVHYYHVYADGNFENIVSNHFFELQKSNLMAQFSNIRVGIVGAPHNRERAISLLPSECEIVATAESGWEQVTLTKLHQFAKETRPKALVFYAHTKGAYDQSDLATKWRISMTHDTVTRWRECVAGLAEADVAGAFWVKSGMPEHTEHKHFFAGNFWWATTDYLRTLPIVRNQHRYQAEGWIGLGDPKPHIMRAGVSYFGNFWQP